MIFFVKIMYYCARNILGIFVNYETNASLVIDLLFVYIST